MTVEPVLWSLTIPSDLRLMALARAFVEAVCQVAGLNPQATHQVVLATDEAASNVVRHAHRERADCILHLECIIKPEQIEVCLFDEGDPFDLESVPHLDPAELRPGGRGVFLMRRIMDELSVEPRPEGGNILRMIKRIPREDG